MRYRIHRRTGDRVSEIGLGSAYMHEAGRKEAVAALRCALEGGVNYFDMGAADIACFPYYAEALGDAREKIFYQIHFGADYARGSYAWSMRLADIEKSVPAQLAALGTDHIDYGMIHCQDEEGDWKAFREGGALDYLLSLKERGVVRHVGLSSHTPRVIETILDTGLVDTLMFSLNPGYDYGQGEYANGEVDERATLLRRCEREGIGVTVMKPFSGGQLLDAALSPFRRALTPWQCMRYALDRPAVLTVLPGAGSVAQVEELLRYYEQPGEALDYSLISEGAPEEALRRCVYCNHCQPCPAGLDIALINKYYDLAMAGDALAKEHYLALEKTASDCVGCGHCDRRCPFSVAQTERMREIARAMGR